MEAVDPGVAPAGSSESPGLRVLDINAVRELWSRTYNTSGKPDWSHLYPYYHPDVVFQDTIQRIEGISEFVALCERLTKRCASIQMEILDLQAVRKAADILLRDYPRIDVLINSAGLHSTSRIITRDGLETVFCVNHLAPFLLTSLLLERLKQTAPARVIQVNSEGHRFGGLDLQDLNWQGRHYSGFRAYGASKVAQLLTTWEFADRLQRTGVTINAMHPGDVKTNIGMNNGPLYRWFQRNMTWHMLKDPIISGEALYYLAAAPEMAEVSGRFFHLTIDEKPAAHALDREKGRLVWEVSKQLTGLP